MATLTSGNVYRITNKATGKALNYYNGNASVNVYDEDGTMDQNWYFNSSRLFTEHNRTTKCLGKSGSSTPIATYSSGSTSTQGITATITLTNNYGDYVTIMCDGNYLTSSGTSLSWTSTKSGTNSEWLCEKLHRVSMPSCGTEYFHTLCGVASGTFTSSYATKLRAFAKSCFGERSVSDPQLFYNAYGALMFNAGTDNNGKFHLGIDMSPGGIVTAPFAGTVKQTTTNYGQVVIQNDANSKFFVFMHLDNITATVGSIKKGVAIGTMAGIGKNGASVFSPHLHVEVHSTNRTGQNPVANSKVPLADTLCPYLYI